MKRLSLLGSTGSIGVQTLEVIRETNCARVVGLAGNNNVELLAEQALEFSPEIVCVYDEVKAIEFEKRIRSLGSKAEVCFGLSGLNEVAKLKSSDIVLNSLVGRVGLEPTIEAIKSGKDIALANKETLVCGGELIMGLVKKYGVKMLPVDSEHSAIFQCLQGNEGNEISKLILTASGGPFRERAVSEFGNITIKDALSHPNWSMGAKISIDSATMMNKGLEVIEAKWLFGVGVDKIEVLVHPQSVIHSMVEFMDGAVMAQLGEADMKVPIAYGLTYPKRVATSFKKLNFMEHSNLTFEKPDMIKFECLQIAFDAIKAGGLMPCVMNGANEEAVSMFLAGEIGFTEIPFIIKNALSAYNDNNEYDLDGIVEADRWVREYVKR